MTVQSTIRRAGPFPGNGVATAFDFEYKVFEKSDLNVVLTTVATGAFASLVLDSDYSVTLNADQDNDPGGTVTYPLSGSPMAATHKLTILSDVPQVQSADLLSAGGWKPRVIEDALDRTVILVQEQDELVSRAFVVPPGETGITLPNAVERANKTLGFDAAGVPIVFDPSYGALTDAININYTPLGLVGNSIALDELLNLEVYVQSFMTSAERDDVRAFTAESNFVAALDVSDAVEAAFAAVETGTSYKSRARIRFGPGGYKITRTISIPPGAMIEGSGRGVTKIYFDGGGSALFEVDNIAARVWDISISDLEIKLKDSLDIGVHYRNCIAPRLARVNIEGPMSGANESTAVKISTAGQDSFYGLFESVLTSHVLKGFHITGTGVAVSQMHFVSCQAYGDYSSYSGQPGGYHSVFVHVDASVAGNGGSLVMSGGYGENLERGLLLEGGAVHVRGVSLEQCAYQIEFAATCLPGSHIEGHGITPADVLDNTTHKKNFVHYNDSMGSWTPGIGRLGDNVTGVTFNYQRGQWQRIGNLVIASAQLDVATVTNPAAATYNYISMDGLPGANGDYKGVGVVYRRTALADVPDACGVASDSGIYFVKADGTDLDTDWQPGLIEITIAYFVN